MERGEVDLGNGDSVVLDPLPVQRPHPPLWVAAFGPKALAQAGRLGLSYLASPIETGETLAENYRHHGDAASAAGHEPLQTVPLMRTIFISANRRQVRALRERMSMEAENARRSVEGASIDDWGIVGDKQFVRDRISEYRERFGVSPPDCDPDENCRRRRGVGQEVTGYGSESRR
jgi:alkanesulfonate monooxygenase SsuD/methylene tetrahydromethanopterin reductase-like flavin-dependent oxidoreductase (luciferase family)